MSASTASSTSDFLFFAEMQTIIKSNYEEVPRYVDIILGQRYRKDRNELLQEESFSGRLADVTIYRQALSEGYVSK